MPQAPTSPKTTSPASAPTSGSCAALYGSTLDKVLQRGVLLNYYPQSDVAGIKAAINQMASKWGFSADDFGVFTLIESDGMDPKANNNPSGIGCVGIIQWCAPEETVNTSASAILGMSTLQQLALVDRYFEQAPLKKGADQVTLYLSVLYPTAQAVTDPNESLLPAYETSQQAKILLNGGGQITRTSIGKALNDLAKDRLGCAPDPSAPGKGVLGNQGGLPVSPAGVIGTDSAVLSGANCPPPPYNQRDRIIYAGCQQKIATATQGGSGVGYGANGTAYPGSPVSGTNGLVPYTGPLRPGAFVLPTKGAVITSRFKWRNGRQHAGIDFAAPVGTTLYAIADGTVDSFTGINHPNAGQYGNIITLNHAGGVKSRYGHPDSITVAVGQEVKQGQIIGTIGQAGNSTGPHLHFEIRPNDNPVDPSQFYTENLSEQTQV